MALYFDLVRAQYRGTTFGYHPKAQPDAFRNGNSYRHPHPHRHGDQHPNFHLYAHHTSTFTPTVTRTATKKPTSTRLPATKVPGVAPSGKVPAGIQPGEHWIDVDISKQRAYAYEGNTLVRSFVVSTGIAAYPTVTGTYRIYVKYRYAPMSGVGWYLPNVPYVMYFYKGYGLHGTYWHNNFGVPMSHGCINFTIADAGWVYNFTVVGTVVHLHY